MGERGLGLGFVTLSPRHHRMMDDLMELSFTGEHLLALSKPHVGSQGQSSHLRGVPFQ